MGGKVDVSSVVGEGTEFEVKMMAICELDVETYMRLTQRSVVRQIDEPNSSHFRQAFSSS
jgi:hypothetical protein